MPIYEYLCPDGHRFEVVQRFADDPIAICEVCGKSVQRVLHAPAVHYKGKGFYATDYGRKGANGAKPDSGAPSESGSKETAASSSSGGSDGNSSSGSESGSKSESKGSSSKSSSGEGSSSKKTEGSKPAA